MHRTMASWRASQLPLHCPDALFSSMATGLTFHFFNTEALLLTSFEGKFIFLHPLKP